MFLSLFFLSPIPFIPSSQMCEDLQMICGFSCEDLISMFKELKSLGVVVKELSNELRQLVSDSELSDDCFRLPASSSTSIIIIIIYPKSVQNLFKP